MREDKIMKKPEMILFDYGNTLICESGFDAVKPYKMLYPYIIKNPLGLTPGEISEKAQMIWNEIGQCHERLFEVHEHQYLRLLMEITKIEISISFQDAERIIFNNMTQESITPDSDKMIHYLNRNKIRKGVISNISWSAQALTERINHAFDDTFEFVVTSSEYVFRKPSKWLFDVALQKAGLSADKVWYCGDNFKADILGAYQAGMYPVWYEKESAGEKKENGIKENEQRESGLSGDKYLHIRKWTELMDVLEACE